MVKGRTTICRHPSFSASGHILLLLRSNAHVGFKLHVGVDSNMIQKTLLNALTVRDALVLDLQVFVRAGAGVREDVRPSHHRTLGPIVTSAGETDGLVAHVQE